MSGQSRTVIGRPIGDRSAVDQRVGPRCLTISVTIVVILGALALVALL